jgi:spore coat polysaccharide biosynthesis protein SpsF
VIKYNSQEKFWLGSFNTSYIKRNNNKQIVLNNYHFFKKILKKIKIHSLIEIGSNIGLNLIAINKIFKNLKITAVEINKEACKNLQKIKNVKIINESVLKFNIKSNFDLVLIKALLIHINPNNLKKLYKKIAKLSKKYILICEYYNPTLITIDYRGHKNKLFKNDYAGDFLKIHKNYKLIDYGFIYHLDKFPLDDFNWFLLKRF